MYHKLVRDIMVPLRQYPCIADTHTLRDAIKEMSVQILRTKHATLPRVALVFDRHHTELLGMLRRRDIMRGLEPKFLVSGAGQYQRKLFDVQVDANLAEFSYDKMIEGVRKRADRLVRDYMIPIRATINHDDHMMKGISEMVEQNTSLLPVLEGDRVVGVLRSVDLLSELAAIICS